MKSKRFSSNRKDDRRFFVGRQIKATHVLCIDQDNNNCGIVPTSEAIAKAKTTGLDLVQISSSPNGPPTCKILDFSKFKYELSKKEKASKKKQRESLTKVKEIRFRPTTDENDLKIKAKQAQSFIDEGHKVKVTIAFKGRREMSNKSVAEETWKTFISLIPNAHVISDPAMSGRYMTAVISKGQLPTTQRDIAS